MVLSWPSRTPCAALALIAVIAAGACDLSPSLYEDVELQQGVEYISARRFEKHRLERLVQNGRIIKLTALAADGRIAGSHRRMTIFVHGYNVGDRKVARYFSGLLAGLRSAIGHDHRFVVFDWPSLAIPFDDLPSSQRLQLEMQSKSRNPQIAWELAQYRLDRKQAEKVGAPALIALLEHPAVAGDSIGIVAHSMGCHVVALAMRERPDLFGRLSHVAWLAPDLDQREIMDVRLLAAVKRIGKLSVFYSRNDGILEHLSTIANLAPRLGARGPPQETVLPSQISFVDATDMLGTDGVHSRYVEDGLISNAIAKELARL